MRLCKYCDEEVIEKTFPVGDGMDGVTVCLACDSIEGDTYEVDDDGWHGDDSWGFEGTR